LHILQLVSRFPPLHVGGVETVVFNLSKRLVERGHRVTVLTSSDSWSKIEEGYDGIRVSRLPCLFKLGYTSPLLPSSLLEAFMSGPYDVVHAHIPDGYLSPLSPLISMLGSCPLILTVHNFPLGETPRKKVLGRILSQVLEPTLHLSRRIFIHNTSYLGLPGLKGLREKICVTPLGVDLSRFHPRLEGSGIRERWGIKDDPVLLFVSVLDRSHWYKGLSLLLRSIKHLRGEARKARLIVVGAGDARADYVGYARRLGVDGRVIFAGYIGDRSLPSYYASSDLVVLPSTSMLEGFGLVAAEGMASGKATIVSSIAGISSFLRDGEDAVVLGDMNVQALADAISRLIGDVEERRLIGVRARETAESRFDWKMIAGRILKEYEQVLAEVGPG